MRQPILMVWAQIFHFILTRVEAAQRRTSHRANGEMPDFQISYYIQVQNRMCMPPSWKSRHGGLLMIIMPLQKYLLESQLMLLMGDLIGAALRQVVPYSNRWAYQCSNKIIKLTAFVNYSYGGNYISLKWNGEYGPMAMRFSLSPRLQARNWQYRKSTTLMALKYTKHFWECVSLLLMGHWGHHISWIPSVCHMPGSHDGTSRNSG